MTVINKFVNANEKLSQKEVQPPFIPSFDPADPDFATNFDPQFTRETADLTPDDT